MIALDSLIYKLKEIKLINSFISFLYPYEKCPVCKTDFKGLCTLCSNNYNYYGGFYLDDIKGNALFYYSKTPERLIYNFKKNGSYNSLFELTKLIKKRLDDIHILDDISYVLYVPSSKKMIKDRGYDAGYKILFEVLRNKNIKILNLFSNNSIVENKTLNKEEREKNSSNIVLNNKISMDDKEKLIEELKNKRIILFDDIITTGSSLKRCIDLLKNEFNIDKSKIEILVVLKK